MLVCGGLDGYVDGCVSARMDSMVVDCVDMICACEKARGWVGVMWCCGR